MLLAIGDIHGCLNALWTLVATVPITESDSLVTLGDYIDRGPDSRGVLDWLIYRQATGRLVPLRGNHELMLLAARESPGCYNEWLDFGGRATLTSFLPPAHEASADPLNAPPLTLDLIEPKYWRFIEETCSDWCETPTHFFVHAGADADTPLAEQDNLWLFWEHFNDPPPHCSGKIMVCGHTAQKSGLPRNIGHAVCIDTWVYGAGWLTCLEPATGRYWQANQRGESRSGWLEKNEPKETADG
jgi:serine/threonine protein phosphatase 1